MNVMMMREMRFTIAQSMVRMDPSKLVFTIATVNNLSILVTPCH